MICRYILLQNLKLADNGQLFCTSVGGIDDAEDEHHKEHKVHETEKGSNEGAESPADRIQDGVKDGGHDPPSHLGDRQYQALVGVESCEPGFRRCKDGDQHEPGEVCQNTHDLVLFNIRFVKISGGVSSVVQSCDLCREVVLIACRLCLLSLCLLFGGQELPSGFRKRDRILRPRQLLFRIFRNMP